MNIIYFAAAEEIPGTYAGFIHTFEIAKNIQKLGNRITLYARSHSRFSLEEDKRYKNIDVKYIRFPVSFLPYYFLYFHSIWSSHKKITNEIKNMDIIHERFWVPEFFGKYYAKKYGVSFILEVNSPFVEELYTHSPFQILAKWNRLSQFKFSKAIITQTVTLKRILEKITDIPIFVVPNGVDVQFFQKYRDSKKIRGEYNIKNDEILIIFVGVFGLWHGVHLIPKIAKKISKMNCKVKFMLVGGGPLFRETQNEINKSEVKTNVILTGPQKYEKIPSFLAASDVLIAPFDASKYPYIDQLGFWWNPLKLYEYMGAGKPIVTFDYDEVQEIIRDGGLLAKRNDLDDFVRKLASLIEDEELRKSLGKRAEKIAGNEYTWDRRARETLKVYNEVA